MRHPRPELAETIATQLFGKAALGDAHNGLFLAAPRRTGKSTFLQADLQPVLESHGAVVVYVDLWAHKARDPADLIAEALARVLVSYQGKLAKAANKAGVTSVGLGSWLKIDTARIGKPDGATLTDALRGLCEASGKPVALVIDEAQHALSSTAGENAMAALKSARDQLNRPGEIKLMLVMSGSDRDKLLRLVNTSGAPFYGSGITRMPLLGQGYVDHAAQLIAAQRPDLGPIDTHTLMQAFELMGQRPQFFARAVSDAINPLLAANGEQRFEQSVLQAAREQQHNDARQLDAFFQALRPLEQAVLWRMLEQGERFRPYDAEALRFYRDKCPGQTVSVAKAQAALEYLRDGCNPALVWKSARGEYAPADTLMVEWYRKRLSEANWPPAGPQLDLDMREPLG